ncbi:F-box only protein 33 isoform X1 [Athalia rosae]|uniref:F-box only protein 33 isoform X1 n=2 Tax=Athalia rosae TaxID=37344 RepID=UPI0020337C0D|nr:F-box only protein 33 isoform X1 [Athalia rosae]XP_048508439.1 F-box only protein 33 isoform X1 [Athalia rosae]
MVRSQCLLNSDLQVPDNNTTLEPLVQGFPLLERKTGEGEGQQLSSETANSCSSSCKSVNRITEMAQEDNSPCWNNLPSVILLEIFSYLPHDEKIAASQVCRNWRYALFHPCFWKKMTFKFQIKEEGKTKARFLANCFGRSVREATIKWDTAGHCVNETSKLLTKLSFNIHLRKLFLEPSSCLFEWPTRWTSPKDEGRAICTPLMGPLLKIVKNALSLQALSLGCAEELAASAGLILSPLKQHQANHLTHLSLASVKYDPDDYILTELDTSVFRSFRRLSILTIDYDYVDDNLLKALDNGLMERLVIHVHGLEENHPGTTNDCWLSFVDKNPRCELRLNLLHSYDAVIVLDTDILKPAMPLAYLKVLFCESVNVRALDLLSGWYPHILRSVIWIDSVDSSQCMPATSEPDRPDPLVLLAWTCTKLTEIVFLGYKYFQEELLAIARLRGLTLKRLEFAERDLLTDISSAEDITNEINEIMGGSWEPLSDINLPLVVMDPVVGDSIEVIMPMVLRDQK